MTSCLRKLACIKILGDKVAMDNVQDSQRALECWEANVKQTGDGAYPFPRCNLIQERIHSNGEGQLTIGLPDERAT